LSTNAAWFRLQIAIYVLNLQSTLKMQSLKKSMHVNKHMN